MFRYVFILLLIFPPGAIAQSLPPDEINDALAHAEALYYEARFTESIQLLSRVDGLLQATPGRLEEKTNVKLQLALAYIGMNDNNEAKSYLAPQMSWYQFLPVAVVAILGLAVLYALSLGPTPE